MTSAQTDMYRDRVIYMDTRADICRCITVVQSGDKLRQEVRTGKMLRAQCLGIWPDRIDQKARCHAEHQCGSTAVKVSDVFGLKKKKDQYTGNVCKPHKIRNDKKFIKWDPVIDNAGNIMKFHGISAFQPEKPDQINRHI